MISTLIMLMAAGAVALFWLGARAAAERARDACLRACRQADVQLLDHSVALSALSLRRNPDGRIGLIRRYAFEFSIDGNDRREGSLELHGDRLLWVRLALPEPPAT